MQNQYFGDIGDFVKYGLLRRICGLTSKKGSKRKLSLGVVWYLMPDEGNNDGKRVSYLEKREEYRQCDPDLYDFLKKIVHSGRFKRKVSHIQKSGLFPPRSVYHDEILPYGDDAKMLKEQRLEHRKKWLDRAKETVCKSDVIFCDPDNGFEVKTIGKQNDGKKKNGGKYVFWDEAKQLYDSKKQTVVFYQHRPQKKAIDKEIKDRVREVQRNLLPGDSRVVPIRFKGDRMFFVIPTGKHRELVFDRIHEMKDAPWARVGLEVDDH